MNDYVRQIVKEYVESSDEWQAYIQELKRKDGMRLLQSLLKNENISLDMVKKAAAICFPPNEIDSIIEKVQNEIKESEANDENKILSIEEAPICTRDEALQLALRKVNQGCCVQYVSDGLKEWLDIEITPEELDSEIANHPDLLPSNQRLQNAWYNIRHVEPDDMTRFQIQQKYGFDCAYQDLIFESDRDNDEHPQYAVGDIQLGSITPTAEFSEYAEKERRGELTPEDKQKFLQKPYTTEAPSPDEIHALSERFLGQNKEAYKALASHKERPE